MSLIRRIAEAAVRAAILGGAAYFLARGMRWGEVSASLRQARVLPLVGVVALNAGMMSIKAVRLRMLLGPGKASFGACFLTLLTASAINNVIPLRGGDVARVWMLERRAGVTKFVALAVAAVEQLIDLAALGLMAFGASLLTPRQGWATVTAPLLLATSLALLLVMRHLTVSAALPAAASHPRRRPLNRPRAWLAAARDRIRPCAPMLRSPALLARALALGLAAWACEMAMVLLCGAALSTPVSPALALVMLLGINIALALPSTPANAGPFEGAVVVVLVLAGVSKPAAFVFGLIYHAVQVIPVTAAGLLMVLRSKHGRGAGSDVSV